MAEIPEKGAQVNSSFDRAADGKNEWLTPPEIVKALGPFDLDPCAPAAKFRPWSTAARHYSWEDDGDGRAKAWAGLVWCNPPYGSETGAWLLDCARHGSAIALTFARTETDAFFDAVWGHASAVLFLHGRVRFWEFSCKACGFGHSHHAEKRPKGSKCTCTAWEKSNKAVQGGSSGAPSVLIAYGAEAVRRLEGGGIAGKLVRLTLDAGDVL